MGGQAEKIVILTSLGEKSIFSAITLNRFRGGFTVVLNNLSTMSPNIAWYLAILSVIALVYSIQVVWAFDLKVNLFNVKEDSGKLGVSVTSTATDKDKSRTIGVGRLDGSTITDIIFTFSEKDLPPNGDFIACVHSYDLDKSQCEQAERHYDAKSAVIWIEVPGS
jgi:hypothetical protein